MKAGKYTIKELFLNKNIEQIIIPEMQRDYVWGKEQIIGLLDSISNDFTNYLEAKELKEVNINCDPEIKNMFEIFYKQQKYSSNIGFIYAYDDKEYKDKYFLIDGQQRLTTIYILLFALSNLLGNEENLKFKKNYFNDRILKIDFKVREIAHNFLFSFIDKINEDSDLNTIKNNYWYFSQYNNDVTITSIINNYQTIIDYFNNKKIDLLRYKNYIENYVEFWFFDTNLSEQGEELYLFMNSRGEAMQNNENLKALLLKNISNKENKHKYGTKWEEWQHFFWQNKDRKENSDDGFNEFIKWIVVLEYFKDKKNKVLSVEKQENILKEIIKTEKFIQYISYITFEIIEEYMNVIQKLNEYELMNINWLSGGETKQNDIINLYYIRILPLLTIAKSDLTLDKREYLRFKKFFENITRFEDIAKNPFIYILRSLELVNTFKNGEIDILEILNINDDRFKNIITDEEIKKLNILKANNSNRNIIEDIFWRAEENEFLNGKISILLNLNEIFNFGKFEQYTEKFIELFSNVKSIKNKTRSALLSYDDYGFYDGRTGPYRRFSYEITQNEWKDSDRLDFCVSELLKSIIEQNSTLDSIIEDFSDEDDWRYYFIKCEKVFKYTSKKKITFDKDDNPINLLKKSNAKSDMASYSEFIKNKCL